MSKLRFHVGDDVMCNMGESGWRLGTIVALHYREPDWPEHETAPYQVLLDGDRSLVYVPQDDARLCRQAAIEDLRIARRADALAEPDSTLNVNSSTHTKGEHRADLRCDGSGPHLKTAGYREGRCEGCDCCPQSWSAVELYSEHYRCAERNGLRVTRLNVDLGTLRVGDVVEHTSDNLPIDTGGFSQCPTLVRLPPGLCFSDDGALTGDLHFDPHRGPSYWVDFVAISTAAWRDPAVGIVRLQLSFLVEGNEPPDGFNTALFEKEQHEARTTAKLIVRDLVNVWIQWEHGDIDSHETCDQMREDLCRLRGLLERHPRLDDGIWWAQLGGFHMNIHKLLENALLECELYLGHALTFGHDEVRRTAEQNLEGCYKKRLLEAARFLWIDGTEQLIAAEYVAAAETFRRAAAKQDGWGWAVNYGDIWLSESAARLTHGVELLLEGEEEGDRWIAEAKQLAQRAAARANDADVFGPAGHPWASEIQSALGSLPRISDRHSEATQWLREFKDRTLHWCAQILAGVPPFPPQPRPRREDAAELAKRLRRQMP